MFKKYILPFISSFSLLLATPTAYAEDGWVSGVKREYSYVGSKWVSASDNNTTIMSKLRQSYSYNTRMPKIQNLTYRQNQIMTYVNNNKKHYALVTYTDTPYAGFTRWYDSPYGVLLDYLTPFSANTTTTPNINGPDPGNLSDAVHEYNKIQFPNGNKTVYLASNSNDLVDAKIASASMATNKEYMPLVIGDLNGTSYPSSVFSKIDQLKAKTIIMLGGTGLIESTSGLSSNYNIIRVGGYDRLETENYLKNLPTRTQSPSSYKGDGNGVVMMGLNNSSVYNELLSLSKTQNIEYLKRAVQVALNSYSKLGVSPSRGQAPSIILGVNNGDFETYWICYFYEKDYGRAVYQYVLPNYFPKISLSHTPKDWTKGNVTVSASISVDSKVSIVSKKWAEGDKDISYFNSSGNTLGTSNSFTVSNNSTYTVYVKDSYGNETTNKINITNIDKINPSCSASITNITTSGFNVVIDKISDSQSGVNKVEICAYKDGQTIDGIWQTVEKPGNSATFKVNVSDYDYKAGTYSVIVKISDYAGNTVNTAHTLTAKVPFPTVHSSPIVITNHEYTSNGVYWVKAGDSFTAKAYGYTNPDSPRYKINYEFILARSENSTDFSKFKAFRAHIPNNLSQNVHCYNFALADTTFTTSLKFGTGSYSVRTSGSWVDSYFNLILDGDETVKLTPLVRVNADNLDFDSTWSTDYVIVKSDSQAPTITLSSNTSQTWSNFNAIVSIDVSDTRSGVSKWTVRRKVNNGAWINLSNNIKTVSLTDEGVNTIEVTATDNVGNTSTKSIVVNIDKSVPNIILTASTYDWTNQNIIVSAAISDTYSGVLIKKWAEGNRDVSYFKTSGTNLDTSFVVSNNAIYSVYAKDNAGNEIVKTINIGNIDKVNPTISGSFDNDWVKGTKTLTFTSNDNLSGILSLNLYDEKGTTLLKTGTINNNSGSLTYTFTADGISKYKIITTDKASNSYSNDITIRIDNTAPTLTAIVPSIVNERNNISITLNNIFDNQSGVKEAWVSESTDFSSGVTKVPLSKLTTKTFNFTLSVKDTIESHFSVRPIYIRIFDNVGNLKNYTEYIQLIPKNPDVPTITSPKDDTLYVRREPMIFNWTYNSIDEDLGALSQVKAEFTFTLKDNSNKPTNTQYTFVIFGEKFEVDFIELGLDDVKFGDYMVTVKVFNHLNPEVYTESKPIHIRYNSFKTDGTVFTRDICTTSPIRYLSISTKYELPKDAKIEGFIYYEKDALGNFNLNKYIKFELSKKHLKEDPIALPNKTANIKIEYRFTRSPYNKLISPSVEHISVMAK